MVYWNALTLTSLKNRTLLSPTNIRGVVFGTGISDTEALESLSEWSLNGTSLSLVTVENSVTREILAQNVPW